MSNPKYYTSTVPAHRSISNIQGKLSELGVRNVTTEYDDSGEIEKLIFDIEHSGKTYSFCLQPKVKKIEKLLKQGYKRSLNNKQRSDIAKQAKRTAWKLLSEFIEIQATLISVGQSETFEVFLPFMLVEPNTTLFQKFKREQLLLEESVDERV